MVGPSTKADIGVHCQPAVQSHSHRGTQNLNFRLADHTTIRLGQQTIESGGRPVAESEIDPHQLLTVLSASD